MTLPPHKIGDQGQRYAYYVTQEMGDDVLIGYGNSPSVETLQKVADIHPSWLKAYAVDRHGDRHGDQDRTVAVKLPMSVLVPVTSNDGGYLGLTCLCCNASGYVRNSRYGYRAGTEQQNGLMGNEIVHKTKCPLNKYIDERGGLICGERT